MNKLTLIIISLLTLTACGGSKTSGTSTAKTPTATIGNNGGGNTGNVSVIGIGNGGGNAGNNPPLNNGIGNTTAQSQLKGNQIAINANHRANANVAINTTSELNKITLNGKTIDIIPTGISSGAGLNHLKDSNNERVVGQGADMRYGYIKTGNETPHLFAQGKASTNTPQSGKATYRGNAVNVALTEKNGRPTGTAVTSHSANFEVDFGSKLITGKIHTPTSIDLAGRINGNTFAGQQKGMTMQGYFYGDKASELGGTYRSADSTVSGAFGAKKSN